MNPKSLCLYADYTNLFSYYNDWLDAFSEYDSISFQPCNIVSIDDWDSFSKQIEQAPHIVILHSITADSLKYLDKLKPSLLNRKGKLSVFVGNEVNLPTFGMGPKISILKEIAPEIIVSQLLEDTAKWLYKECQSSTVLSIPHALNPNTFKNHNPFESRLKDIGARSAKYNAFLGDKDRENILSFFQEKGQKHNLITDIKIGEGRFNRQEWSTFLSECRGTVATEAGSFYLDRDDKIVQEVVSFVKKKKGIRVINDDTSFVQLLTKIIPKPIKSYMRNITKNHIQPIFDIDLKGLEDEILTKFFSESNKCPYYSKAISSRHFDAIGAGTVQIMFSGRYNDILHPGDHYIEMKKDFSNFEEVLSIFSNHQKVKKITNQAYQYVLEKHTHNKRIQYLCGYF